MFSLQSLKKKKKYPNSNLIFMESCLSLVNIDTCGSTNVTSAHTRRCITNSKSGHFFFLHLRVQHFAHNLGSVEVMQPLCEMRLFWLQGTVSDAGGQRHWLACSLQHMQAPGEHGKNCGTKSHHEFTLDCRSPACPSTEKYCWEFAKCTKRCCFHRSASSFETSISFFFSR